MCTFMYLLNIYCSMIVSCFDVYRVSRHYISCDYGFSELLIWGGGGKSCSMICVGVSANHMPSLHTTSFMVVMDW